MNEEFQFQDVEIGVKITCKKDIYIHQTGHKQSHDTIRDRCSIYYTGDLIIMQKILIPNCERHL